MVDEDIFNAQIIEKDSYCLIPANPNKNGYVFEGWTINGFDIVNVYNYQIVSNVTFIGKFSVAEGLFEDDGTLIMSWNDMIDNDYIVVDDDGFVSQGTSSTRSTMTGNLLIPEGINGFNNGANEALGTFSDCVNLKSITLPVSLTKIGKYTFYNCRGLTKIVVNSEKIESLGYDNYAFYNAGHDTDGISVTFSDSCKSTPTQMFYITYNSENVPKITSVSFGKNIEKIGSYLFYYNPYLTSIEFPSNVKSIGGGTIGGCKNLTRVIFNEGLESIGANFFNNCESLTSISFPSTLNSIGTYSFACVSLLAVNVHEDNSTFKSVDGILYSKDEKTLVVYPAGRKNSTFTIPSSVTKLDGSCFRHNQYLEKITIPETVEELSSYAFNRCEKLKSVTINAKLTKIQSYAFGNCPSLKYVTLPDSITSILLCAFENTGLTSFTMPNSVTELGTSCFENCESLRSINLSTTLQEIGNSAFENCKSLQSITIPDSVTTIEYYAFRYCESLKTVVIGSGLTELESYSFGYCTSLTSVTIKEGLSVIGISAFNGCTALKSIALPSTITDIKLCAFANCTSLEYMIIPSSVTTIKSRVFENCTSLKGLYIPSTVSEIDCFSYYYSIVKGCSSSLNIYTDASSSSYYWGKYYYVDDNVSATIKYNQSLVNFKSAMGIS